MARKEVMEQEAQMTDEEFDCALHTLLTKGILRPTGEYQDGEMVYESTPDAELSDESRAYAAYLDLLNGDVQAN